MIEICDNFEIEDLGIQEEWVYDIEVEGNHNFFGNNILVHNSVYYQIEPFMDKYQASNPNESLTHYVKWADSFEQKVIQPVISATIDELAHKLNAMNKDAIGAEREVIADAGVFVAKKKYYARVRDNEGTLYPEDKPKIKVMGLETIKSSTPIWAKKYLKEAIPHILDKDEKDLRNWIQEIKWEFANSDINDIADVSGVSRVDYDLQNDRVPIGSRAAIVHNNYVKNNNLEGRYSPIQGGDKCKRIFLNTPNKFDSNIVAWTNSLFPSEITREEVDYDTQFEKKFMKPLSLMVDCLNYNLDKETEELDDW